MNQPADLHRESAAATLVLSEARIKRETSQGIRIGLQVLCSANFLYLHDFWHYKSYLDWEEAEVVQEQCEDERDRAQCLPAQLSAAILYLQEDCEITIPDQLAAMRLRRWRENGDQPEIGEWWGELDSQVAGRAVEVEDIDISEVDDPRYCDCTHGDKLSLHPIRVTGGCGSLQSIDTHSTVSVCSCECSKLLTTGNYSYGLTNSTALSPCWLKGVGDMTTRAPVRRIRAFRKLGIGKEPARPPQELKWLEYLPVPLSPPQ